MPLKLRSIETLPPSPLLKVYFSGLMIVNPINDSSCEIGVHHDSATSEPNRHKLKIGLKVNLPDHAVTRMPIHTGDLAEPFRISVFNPVQRGLRAYQKPSLFYRDPYRGDDGRDLRWAINIEGEEFHREELSSDSDEIKPVINLDNSGTFFTAERTDPTIFDIARKRGDSADDPGSPMLSIASVIGVAIDVAPGGSVELLDSEDGMPLSLPRAVDPPGTTYELYISNRPIGEVTPELDELERYYQVLKKRGGGDIPDSEKWHIRIQLKSELFNRSEGSRLETKERSEGSKFRTDEIPCMPIIKNGGQ